MAFGLIAGLAGSALKKAAGRAARFVTRQAMGSPVRRAVTSVAGGAATGAAATGLVNVGRRMLGPSSSPFSGEGPLTDHKHDRYGRDITGKRPYRRTNYLNQRALKKSIRRVQGFEKIVRQAFTVSKGSLQIKKRRSY